MLRVDTHCHINLYPDPTGVAQRAARQGLTVIAVTNLPSEFEGAFPHVQGLRNLRLALGLHPLHSQHHAEEKARFSLNFNKTSYIGEVGLDFSREGVSTKSAQLSSFRFVLECVRNHSKLLTIHSRGAETAVLDLLEEFQRRAAILHWFTGPISAAERALLAGHFFSVNTSMVRSGKGRKLIEVLPKTAVLLESDGPFIDLGKRPVEPGDLLLVEEHLEKVWGVSGEEVRQHLSANFSSALTRIGQQPKDAAKKSHGNPL